MRVRIDGRPDVGCATITVRNGGTVYLLTPTPNGIKVLDISPPSVAVHPNTQSSDKPIRTEAV